MIINIWTFFIAPSRPLSPGGVNNVFGLCSLAVTNIGTSSGLTEQFTLAPCGTAFSISPTLVLTAFHNVLVGDRMCLVKSLATVGTFSKILRSDVIKLKVIPFAEGRNDDWILLEREDGTFDSFYEICESDDQLPTDNSEITIKHFPVGLIDSSSVALLQVVSTTQRLCFYSPRLPPASPPTKRQKLSSITFTITDNASDIVNPVADVAFVSDGLSRGSCGAPYFAGSNKVFAFHVESVDDVIESKSNSSSGSHQSYCNGYVLCRLPSFMHAFRNIGNPTVMRP